MSPFFSRQPYSFSDRKACRTRASGEFEFDMHPREEYFEQPRSHRSALGSDEEGDSGSDGHEHEPPVKRGRASDPGDGVSPSLPAMLEMLEQDRL